MAQVKYTKTHEWLQWEKDEAIVGITEHAQELLGDLVFIELPEVNSEINAGHELGVVESVKAASDFYAPVSGIVIAVNQALTANPGLVNTDPFGQGWLLKLKITQPQEIENLLDEAEYKKIIAES